MKHAAIGAVVGIALGLGAAWWWGHRQRWEADRECLEETRSIETRLREAMEAWDVTERADRLRSFASFLHVINEGAQIRLLDEK